MLIQHKRSSTCSMAARVLLEVLQGLFHNFFTSLLSWRRGGIFKGEFRKSVSWTPSTVSTSSQMLYLPGPLDPYNPQGLPKLATDPRAEKTGHPNPRNIYTIEFLCETYLAFHFCFHWSDAILNFPDFSTPMLQKEVTASESTPRDSSWENCCK